MQVSESLGTIIAGITGIGVLALGIGYAYGQFKKGNEQASSEDIDQEMSTLNLLSKRVDELAKLSNAQDKEIQSLRKQVEGLRDAIKERDKKIDEYIAILQNRNPKFEEFVDLVTRVAKEADTHMKAEAKKTADIQSAVHALASKNNK